MVASGHAFDAFARGVPDLLPARRLVHIDLGANDGAWTRAAVTKLCDGRHRQAIGSEPHLFTIVEAQRQYAERIRAFANATHASERGSRCRIEFVAAAAWYETGNVSFASTRDARGAHGGSTEYSAKEKARNSVPAVDFGAYLRRTLRHDDLTFMKIDSASSLYV